MRHFRQNDLSSILNTLNALSAIRSRSGEVSAATRTAETWVERIAKEKWTGEKGLAIASAVVGVGAILYGARKFLAQDKSEGQGK